MNRHTLASFHEQIDSLRSSSIPQVKHFLRKRIAKCINECKIQTMNMKKSIGYSSKAQPSENEYEFGWGSDFDDLEDDEEDNNNCINNNDNSDDKIESSQPCNQSMNQQVSAHQSKSNHVAPKRPNSEPPPPPLPKCPPPDLIEENKFSCSLDRSGENMYETMSPRLTNQLDGDYLLPNNIPIGQGRAHLFDSRSISMTTVIDRPLPPIPDNTIVLDNLHHYPWFHDIEREEAENLLRRLGINGMFLVRKSKRAGISNPYTLTLFYKHRIFHLNIRKRPDRLFALGSEKPKEKTFRSVPDLVDHHSQEPIYLTSKGSIAGETKLISMTSLRNK